MSQTKTQTKTQTKIKKRKPMMTILAFIFLFTAFIQGENTGFKILSYKGKVKVKRNNKLHQLQTPMSIQLAEADALMLYPGASVEMILPSGRKKTIEGPLYTAIQNLEKPLNKDAATFFKKPGLWAEIEKIFNEEGDDSIGNTKGTQKDSLKIYNSITQLLAKASIEDKPLAPHRLKKIDQLLNTAQDYFDAFPELKQTVIRALVCKDFGLNKKAMDMTFSYYDKILYQKNRQLDRETMESYLFNQFLPIIIAIGSNGDSKQVFTRQFASNLKLWWGSFFFDGNKLEIIENTIDSSPLPQKTFAISKRGIKSSPDQRQWLFIVACADWEELDRLFDMETAKQELLESGIEDTRMNIVQGFSKIIITFSL